LGATAFGGKFLRQKKISQAEKGRGTESIYWHTLEYKERGESRLEGGLKEEGKFGTITSGVKKGEYVIRLVIFRESLYAT